jgi:hypothetical protein
MDTLSAFGFWYFRFFVLLFEVLSAGKSMYLVFRAKYRKDGPNKTKDAFKLVAP